MRTAIITAAFVLLSACSTQIQHGLEERDANEIVSALVSRGFDAKKVPEKAKKPTWAVEVEDANATDAMRILTELKLPRPSKLTTRQISEQSSLIETPQAERLRALEAEEGDIEQALESMDGVTSAAVELVVPAAPRPGVAPTPSKASVLIRVQPDSMDRLTQQRAELRALVAASVEGLKPDDVVLVLDPVTSHVASLPAEKPAQPLRALVIAMGAVLTVLAMLLVVLGVRMRSQQKLSKRAPVLAPALPEVRAPARPVVSPNVQRKVA